MKKILILGGGEHAINIIDLLLNDQSVFEPIGILDSDKKNGISGVPVLGGDEILPDMKARKVKYAFPAVGWGQCTNSNLRLKLYNKIKNLGFNVPNLFSSRATISSTVKYGEGNFVQAGTVIEGGTKLGNNILIGANVSIANDCKISDHVTIAGGVCMSGKSIIGEGSILGTGAIIYRNVGSWCKVAPGSVCLIKDVPDRNIAFGNPTRYLPQINNN